MPWALVDVVVCLKSFLSERNASGTGYALAWYHVFPDVSLAGKQFSVLGAYCEPYVYAYDAFIFIARGRYHQPGGSRECQRARFQAELIMKNG